MPHLSVNLDMVAVMRESRRLGEPDPAQAAVLAEMAGADGITIQLRRDRRFVRDRDLYLLRGVVKTKLNFEMPPSEDVIEKALEVKPWMVTLVADHADGAVPVSTIDFKTAPVDYHAVTDRLGGVGINVAFFVEPDNDDIKGAAKSGAAAVMIDCGGYTEARTLDEAQAELDRIDRAAQAAAKADLTVLFGRGINQHNVGPLVELGVADEYVVGYAICSRAMLVGFDKAVSSFRQLISAATPASE